jgi:hypothetical protein
MILKALVAVCLALSLALGWLWITNDRLEASNARLQTEVASLERSVATLQGAVTQARLAADVAKAVAARERAANVEFERLRDAFRDGNDEILPCWFRNGVAGILGRLPEPECSN